jgi:Carboxypeptidase regulatory-like domain
MKRFLLTLPFVLHVLGCRQDSSLPVPTGPTGPPPPPPATYTLSGIVSDPAGPAIADARVGVENPPHAGRFSLTDSNGRYRLSEVSGTLEVRVTKDGYFRSVDYVPVTRDTNVNWRLEPVVHLSLGTTVSGTVRVDGPGCYPLWDLQARCQQFLITPPADGTLELTLAWDGIVEMEIVLMGDDENAPLAAGLGPSPSRLTAQVSRGESYEVRVLGYFYTIGFELSTVLRLR